MSDPSASSSGDERRIAAAGQWDPLEERDTLAAVEAKMFDKKTADPFRLSRYVVLRRLGSGAAGVAYQGYDPELDRAVAIKVLRPTGRMSLMIANTRERFIREAKLVAKFAHPNVIAVHDVGTFEVGDVAGHLDPTGSQSGTGVFIVMELVQGGNLDHWLADGTRSWKDVLDVFLQAAEGLAAAHAAGIVHRDFKPSNVLIGLDDDQRVTAVKVADFGLAMTVGEPEAAEISESLPPQRVDAEITEDGERLTQTGVLLGTPGYMSPEQHRGELADESADQYAFCTSLYRALFGTLPFAGKTWSDLYNAKLEGQLSFPSASNVPSWLRRVLARGLTPQRAQRYPSMHALIEALRADPYRRARRILGSLSLPLGLAGAVWGASVALQPGVVDLDVTAEGQPLADFALLVDAEPQTVGDDGKLELGAGRHVLEISAPDHDDVVELLEVERGGTHQVDIDLAHERGTVDLEVEPKGGSILIDGVDYGSRLANFPLDTGHHRVLVRQEGHYDARLEFTLGRDQHVREFVALRPALAWSRARSGSAHEIRWVGDYDGDGFSDVLHRYFNKLSIYDPWADETLWTVALDGAPRVWVADLDGDADSEIVTASWRPDGVELVVYGAGEEGAPPRVLWRETVGESGSESLATGDLIVCDQGGAQGQDILVSPPGRGRVVGLGGADGRVFTDFAVADQPLALMCGGAGRMFVLGVDALHAFSVPTGELRWRQDTEITPHIGSIADLSGSERQYLGSPGTRASLVRTLERGSNAAPDVIVQSWESDGLRLDVFTDDGARRWSRSLADHEPPDVVDDVDADGTDDVLLPRSDRVGSLLSGASGVPLWTLSLPGTVTPLRWKTQQLLLHAAGDELRAVDPSTGALTGPTALPSAITMGPRAWDFDSDGAAEIVVGTADSSLVFLDADLQPLASVLLPLRAQGLANPHDGDRDGFDDLLLEARGPMVVRGPKIRWWRTTTDAIRGAPAAGDFDGDGSIELALVGSLDQKEGAYVLDAATGAHVTDSDGARSFAAIRGPEPLPRPDGGLDFIAQDSGRLVRFDGATGRVEAMAKHPHAYARPTVADVDGDGRPEIFTVGWQDPGFVYERDLDSMEVTRKLPLPGGGWGQVVALDVDGDGSLELAATRHDGFVAVYDTSTWTQRWAAQVGARLSFGVTAVARPGTSKIDIAVAPQADDGPLVLLEGDTGKVRWRLPNIGSQRGRAVALDVDDDERDDIFVAGLKGTLTRVSADGEQVWQTRVSSIHGRAPGTSAPLSVADLDGDGVVEVLTGWEDGTVRVFDSARGEMLWVFQTREEIEAAPVAVDVDGDGVLEVVVASHDRTLSCLSHAGPR